MEKKQTVSPGKFVAFSYKMYDDATGELLFEAPSKAPDVMVFGVSHEIVPALAGVMEGLAAGDKFAITLPPEAAFGERSDEYIMQLDKDIFKRDGKMAEEVKVGAILPMQTAEGYRVPGIVTKVDDKEDGKVTMDFNHPFAGKTVRYDGKVEEVRDATPEELKPVHGCGGCGGGSCGDGGDCGGCGDSGSCSCH